MRGNRFLSSGLAVVIWAELTAEQLRSILNLRTRRNFNNFQNIKFGGWVFFTLHNQNVLKALMVFGTVFSWTIAEAVKLEAFQSFTNF